MPDGDRCANSLCGGDQMSRRIDAETRAAVLAAYLENGEATYKEIGKRFGINPITIGKIIKKSLPKEGVSFLTAGQSRSRRQSLIRFMKTRSTGIHTLPTGWNTSHRCTSTNRSLNLQSSIDRQNLKRQSRSCGILPQRCGSLWGRSNESTEI